jgi:hypothetical protein
VVREGERAAFGDLLIGAFFESTGRVCLSDEVRKNSFRASRHLRGRTKEGLDNEENSAS